MELTNAIVCNTPFQLLNAINIVVNNVESGKYDLYLYGEFRNSERILKNILKLKLFDKVFFIKKNTAVKNSKLRTFAKLIIPSFILNDFIYEDISFEEINSYYSRVFVGDGNLIGIYLLKKNPMAELIMFDDGIATNVGNALFDTIGSFYKKIGRLFKLGVYSFNVSKLYVTNKSFCKSTITDNILQLPFLTCTNPATEIAKDIFSYNSNTQLNLYKNVYLGQPLEEKQGFNGNKPLFFKDQIPQFNENLLVRLHPRQDSNEFNNECVDNVNNMWELECMNSISDDHVLIGFCSTAHLMPKLLCDKEPYIIFLYELFLNDKNTKEYENDCSVVETVKELYRRKEKVLVPKTVQELAEFFIERNNK